MFHDTALSNEQRMMRDLLREIARDFPYSYFLKKMRTKAYPDEFFQAVAHTGLLGIGVPEDLGGSQGGVKDFLVLFYFLGNYGFFSFHLLEQFVATFLISRYGTNEQKQGYLPPILKGERISFYLLEDETGEELLPKATRIASQGGELRLSGEKLYVTCVEESQYALVVASLESPEGKQRKPKPVIAILPRSRLRPTLEVRDINIRVVREREERQITGDIFSHARFEEVPLTREDLLPGSGNDPFLYLMSTLFLGMASGFLGIADAIVAKGVSWANQRVIFSEPIASYQGIQHPFVRAKTEVEMAKLLLERAADLEGEKSPLLNLYTLAALSKYQALEAAFQAFDISMQAYGGSAFDRDTGILPYWTLMLFARNYGLNPDRILREFGERLIRSL